MFAGGRDTLPNERGMFPIGCDTLSDEGDTMFAGGRDKSGPYSFRNKLRVDDTLPETGGRDGCRVLDKAILLGWQVQPSRECLGLPLPQAPRHVGLLL